MEKRKPTKPNRSLRLSEELDDQIVKLADAERRSWSQMAAILLEEAIAARIKARK